MQIFGKYSGSFLVIPDFPAAFDMIDYDNLISWFIYLRKMSELAVVHYQGYG